MLFSFIQYINPTWYFNLPSAGRYPYFPDYDRLDQEQRQLLDFDKGYSSPSVSKLDAAYQAWNKGFILSGEDKKLDHSGIVPTLEDNYRFIRRYFHPYWSLYILGLRVLSFNNPFTEIQAFWRQRKVPRAKLYEQVFDHEDHYTTFSSRLVAQNPRVTVIIPTLNRYPWLKDALRDLEQQDYKNFEVIVVDQSLPFRPQFYEQFQLDIRVIRQEEKALWLARNRAVEASGAPYLLLYDDDSRTGPDWISQHLKVLDYFDADLSSGVSISVVGANVPKNYSFLRWGDQVDTGNVMIKRDVFHEIGLFDQQFEGQRMGDGEFGLRAYLAGFKNISNPYARRLHLKVGAGGLREMGSWDAFRPKSWLAPRPVPSVLYLTRKYFGERAAFQMLLTNIAPSLIPYQYKGNKVMTFLSVPLSLLLLPFVGVQVWRAYRISSGMLKEGAKIEGILPV